MNVIDPTSKEGCMKSGQGAMYARGMLGEHIATGDAPKIPLIL